MEKLEAWVPEQFLQEYLKNGWVIIEKKEWDKKKARLCSRKKSLNWYILSKPITKSCESPAEPLP